ncbi:uncharacterized protein BKA55DRAFT_691963 [Fusarium redolens]|uniref:Uncharacterized protein n=1 Tax=Fusarium redolens TaxID=48865 RepID=A0A9P9K4Q4_FUSRE|nr:uncharacterized protein BKA55DRAFT_691963 [Fusarium redolens]KAH7244151.1 hypothetical protein BKA55DRAFT_691963 [Fusarium redolens]
MPKSDQTIPAPLREALFECFDAATRLVRKSLRRQLVLVGGAASIAHSSGVSSGAKSFSLESDGKIAFDVPQGFRVRLDLIEIGNGCIERIHVAEPFRGASVASMSYLLRLRAVTVVERGSDGEVDDFRWLLECVAREGQVLPGLDDQELEYVMGAGACLGVLDRLVLTAVLGANNGAVACDLL